MNNLGISKSVDKKKVEMGIAKFTFKNGDIYEGKYQVNIDKRTLVKQDQGIYITGNFDIYNGNWCDDQFGSGEFHIRYNDNARYKGTLNANGMMDGMGTYIFPDKSSLTTIWSQNKPISNVVYTEPLGYKWMTTLMSENHVIFATVNQFWDEICNASLE